MKKPTATQKEAVKAGGIADKAFERTYPSLCEYLVTEKWDDGTARQPSAISLTIDGGHVNIALNDKALKQSLYCVAPTLAEGLQLLEQVLKDGTGNWRAWKAGKGR